MATRVQIDAKYGIPPLAQDFRHGPADMGQADDHDMFFRSFAFLFGIRPAVARRLGQGPRKTAPENIDERREHHGDRRQGDRSLSQTRGKQP